MSTSTHQPVQDVTEYEQLPDEVFREEVFRNSEICSNCFRRLHNAGRPTAWGSEGHDKVPKASRAVPIRQHATAPGEIGPEGKTIGTKQVPNAEIATYPSATVCEDCGAIGGRADSDPLSRREALRRTETLADRLEEIGEPVDVRELKQAVRRLKSREDTASRDTLCFEAATTVCIRRARSR